MGRIWEGSGKDLERISRGLGEDLKRIWGGSVEDLRFGKMWGRSLLFSSSFSGDFGRSSHHIEFEAIEFEACCVQEGYSSGFEGRRACRLSPSCFLVTLAGVPIEFEAIEFEGPVITRHLHSNWNSRSSSVSA